MPNRYSTPRVKGGTQTLGIEVEGMDRVKVAINGLDHALSDLRPLWPKWRDAFYAAESEAFSGGGNRTSWPGLSASYAAWKATKYPGQPLLVATGALRASLTGAGAGSVYRPAARTLEIGSSVPYANYHQTGTSRMPARPPIAPTVLQHKAFGTAMAEVGRELGALWAKGHR